MIRPNNKTYVELIFCISQHVRDEPLLQSFIQYFDCGKVIIVKNGTVVDFRVRKFREIWEKIIPFFKKHRIHGVKAQDFEDWCKVAELMEQKKHLTTAGLNQIKKKIKVGMNTGRK